VLGELIQYIRSEVRPEYRKLGYLRQAVALAGRDKRLQTYWQQHQQQCHAVIRSAVASLKQRNKVVILGSGLLTEIPLDELAQQFHQAVLVDTVFLPQTRQLIQDYANVEWLEEEVSGLAEQLLQHKSSRQPLPTPNSRVVSLAEGADLVISANLLSQLPLIPLQYMVNHFDYSNQQYVDWGEQIIRDHLQSLASLDAHVVLITDTVHEDIDRKGRVKRREDMLFRVRLPDAAWQWHWLLAPYGENSWRRQTVAHMAAFSHFPYPYVSPPHGQS
jgi:hypothetical protein